MANVRILKRKSYLAMIVNAARGENHLFRNLWADVDGEVRDILNDGSLACAAFVSGVLTLHGLIDGPHATVHGTERAMQAAGWHTIAEPREGAVLSWEAVTFGDGRTHAHLGFSIGADRAVSNASNAEGIPREHHWTYDGTRKVERIWWHPSLEE